MEENAKEAVDINEHEKEKQKMEQAKQELYNLRKQLEQMELTKDFKIVSISKYSEMKLANSITEKNVILIEQKNEEEERTLLYKQLENNELMLIASINDKKEITLDDAYKERYRGILPDKELENLYIQDEKKTNEHKVGEIVLDNKQDIKPNRKENYISRNMFGIAMALGIDENQILSIIEVKDEETMSKVLNKDIDNKNIFIVKLKQDDGKIGVNNYVLMHQRTDGTFEVASKTEMKDTLKEVTYGLGLKDNIQEQEIMEGDLDTVSNPNDPKKYVEINKYRFRDGSTYILEVNRDYQANLHIYREKNGKLLPLCIEEHGQHDKEKLELPGRDAIVDEEHEEEYERTPWNDAEKRRH